MITGCPDALALHLVESCVASSGSLPFSQLLMVSMKVNTLDDKVWCWIQDNTLKAVWGWLRFLHALMAALEVMALCNKGWRRIPAKRLIALWGWLPFPQALIVALHVMTLGDMVWGRVPTKSLRAFGAGLAGTGGRTTSDDVG